MADIQAAMPAKFLQVAGANKMVSKEVSAAGSQPGSFFGVLKSQFAKPDASADIPTDPSILTLTSKHGVKSGLGQPDDLVSDTANLAASISSQGSQAADVSSVVNPVMVANMAAQKQGSEPAQDADSELTAFQQDEKTEPLSHASVKSEGVIQAGGAAIAAVSGQALPQGKVAKQSDTNRIQAMATLETKEGGADSKVLSAASAIRVDASATSASTANVASVSTAASTIAAALPSVTATANPIALPHPFEQALRQAEGRINAAIETPVRSPAFAAELGDKVIWLASRQGQFAELSLNPPQMGALEVRLNLTGSGDASAQFFSPNPAVREAIDAALPRLRELMAQAGINLGEAEVREHAFGRREQAEMRGQAQSQEGETSASTVAMAAIGGVRKAGLGLVDLYV